VPKKIMPKEIIFPIETTQAINEILKKYGIFETQDVILQRFDKQKESNQIIVSKIMGDLAKNKIDMAEIVEIVKTKFGFTEKKSVQLSTEIIKKTKELLAKPRIPAKPVFLIGEDQTKNVSLPPTEKPKARTVIRQTPKTGADMYREPPTL